MWLEKDGQPASFWHDVPLYPDESNEQVVNMVVEIPRWTDGKIEIRRPQPLSKSSCRGSIGRNVRTELRGSRSLRRPNFPRLAQQRAAFCRVDLAAQDVPFLVRLDPADVGEPQLSTPVHKRDGRQ
jgi:hypothetical protein